MVDRNSPNLLSPTSMPKQDEVPMAWPFDLKSYITAMTNGSDVASKLSDFESRHLSKDTAIRWLSYSENQSVQDAVLTDGSTHKIIGSIRPNAQELFFINRFTIKPGGPDGPKDIKRLRISKLALRGLLYRYEMAPSFIPAMLGDGLAGSPIYHRRLTLRNRPILDVWYILPIRAEIECTESARSHILSTSGSNQMDPSQYLHLNDVGRDIRPSKIAVYVQHETESHQTSAICIDFQDGRWWKLAEEPFLRSKETLQQYERSKCFGEPFFIHLLLLTSVSQWWKSALLRFNKQLIAYEKQLQQQMYSPTAMSAESTNETNKALHTMAAHLHRYKTETSLLEEIISYLSKYCTCSCVNPSLDSTARDKSQPTFASSLNVIAADFKSLRISVEELGRKTQTTLGLLFNNIQMANDSLMLANGNSMRKIMKATRAETRLSRRMAKQSQAMAVEMRKDSISMKTIAILTMFFLPGTSYAAILSLPFFSQMKWMGDASRIWLWVVLTIPSTLLAFVVYLHFSKRGAHGITGSLGDDESLREMEMSGIDSDVGG